MSKQMQPIILQYIERSGGPQFARHIYDVLPNPRPGLDGVVLILNQMVEDGALITVKGDSPNTLYDVPRKEIVVAREMSSSEGSKRNSKAQRVLDYLGTTSVSRSPEEIATAIGETKDSIGQTLSNLTTTKKIVRRGMKGYSKYSLARVEETRLSATTDTLDVAVLVRRLRDTVTDADARLRAAVIAGKNDEALFLAREANALHAKLAAVRDALA